MDTQKIKREETETRNRERHGMRAHICLHLAGSWRQVLYRSWRVMKFANPSPDLHSIRQHI